jgi:hypothetical protein
MLSEMSLEGDMSTRFMTHSHLSPAVLIFALCVIPATAIAIPYSYGFAAQTISNFSVTGGIIDSSSFSSLTSTSASVTGLPPDSHDDPTDAIQAFVGPPSSRPPENYFAPKGKKDADYARSDSLVAGAINNWDTANLAESYLATPAISMKTGEAEGDWGFEFDITMGATGEVTFTFEYINQVHVELSSDALFPGSSAAAGIKLEVAVLNADSGASLIFTPSELNIALAVVDPFLPLEYLHQGQGTVGFTTPAIDQGLWTVTVVGEEYAQTSLAKAPTPTALALMGLGGASKNTPRTS